MCACTAVYFLRYTFIGGHILAGVQVLPPRPSPWRCFDFLILLRSLEESLCDLGPRFREFLRTFRKKKRSLCIFPGFLRPSLATTQTPGGAVYFFSLPQPLPQPQVLQFIFPPFHCSYPNPMWSSLLSLALLVALLGVKNIVLLLITKKKR